MNKMADYILKLLSRLSKIKSINKMVPILVGVPVIIKNNKKTNPSWKKKQKSYNLS